MIKLPRILPVLFAFMAFSISGFAEKTSDGYSELAEAIKLARQNDRPIFLQVSTTWCGWCKRMSEYVKTDEAVKGKLADKYQYCKIMHNKESGAGVFSNYPSIPAVPHIFILDQNGGLLHSQYTGSLEKDGSYDPEKFMKLLADWEDYSSEIEKERQTFKQTLQPSEKPKELKDGLVCYFYEGKWSALPKFSELEVQEKSVTTKVCANKYNAHEFVAMRFSGFVQIEKPGLYHIRLSSNDGSRLKLGGETVIDNDGLHPLQNKYSRIELDEGYYPIEVDYFRNGGNYGLIFSFVLAENENLPLKFYHVADSRKDDPE